jgi:two-component system, NtrC family, sensor kinase
MQSFFKKYPLIFNKTVLLSFVIIPIIHFLCAKLSISIALSNGIAPIWPSSGIYAAAILRLGYKVIPGIFLGELIVNTFLFDIYNEWWTRIAIALIDLLDPIFIYFCVQKFLKKRNFLERPKDIFKFIAIIMAVPLLSSNIAICILGVIKITPWEDYGSAWWGWWVGVILSILVITPLLLIWSNPTKEKQPLPRSWPVELLLMIFLIAVISKVSFAQGYPIEYTLLPILVWSAFRFRLQETTVLTLLITTLAIWGTVFGSGAFKRDSVMESLLLLQSFIAVFALTTLVLSAAIRENWLAEFRLKEANENLEEKVEERTLELQDTLKELQLTQAQMIQNEKMSSLGQLVAGVAHEINNPVNFIHGNINYLRNYTTELLELLSLYQEKHPDDTDIESLTKEIDLEFLKEDLPKVMSSMEIGTERIRNIVLSLRNFSRMDEAEFKKVDLHEGIESTLLILQHRIKEKIDQPEIEIIKNYGNLPQIECYAGQLNQVFMNVFVNAIDAIEDINTKENRGKITITTQMINNDWLELRFSDNGKGMSEDVKNRIFDPFFTTKAVGKGTGMGLAISYQIITEKHGGKLECSSKIGEGTEFIISLPVQQKIL